MSEINHRRTLAAIGLLVGALFGACAQRSRFYLRSAVIEFWRRSCADRLAVQQTSTKFGLMSFSKY